MQVSILNFVSRGLKPVGSVALNGEPSSDGPRLQIFPASGEAHEATSTTKKRPLKIAADNSPRSTKDKPSKRPRKNVRTECAALVYTPRGCIKNIYHLKPFLIFHSRQYAVLYGIWHMRQGQFAGQQGVLSQCHGFLESHWSPSSVLCS